VWDDAECSKRLWQPQNPGVVSASSEGSSTLQQLVVSSFYAMLKMSALLLAVGLAALVIAGIIIGALRLVHQGNAGQLLPMLDASVNSFCQQLLSTPAVNEHQE